MIRVDGEEKSRGETRFTADIKIPGMMHGAIARAPVSRGSIKRLIFSGDFDWSSVTIVTPDDIPGENVIHVIHDDMPCLARDRVNYYGEPIALVAAETQELAREAVKNISAEVESEEPVAGIEELVELFKASPEKLTVFKEYKIAKGDIEQGFKESDNIVEGEYFTGLHEHIYLETQGMIAVPEENGKMRVLGSLQCPFYVRPAVATALGMKEEDVIVEQVQMGGAFGGKEDFPSHLGAHAALLAFKSKRPVKIIFDRSEDIRFTTKRHPSYVRHRTGVRRDGTLTAMEIEVLFDAGAYQTLTPVVLSRGILHSSGAYRCPNVNIRAAALKSNMPPAGAFRGF
ncbi:MAG: xanthine dehydrogenase family protein, partial [Deltaproteobacteria bacterium]|nr:xanthine dehydrogenase family protein [Deltaproteobacteria bacterium]